MSLSDVARFARICQNSWTVVLMVWRTAELPQTVDSVDMISWIWMKLRWQGVVNATCTDQEVLGLHSVVRLLTHDPSSLSKRYFVLGFGYKHGHQHLTLFTGKPT